MALLLFGCCTTNVNGRGLTPYIPVLEPGSRLPHDAPTVAIANVLSYTTVAGGGEVLVSRTEPVAAGSLS